ncbi:MAG: type I-E CRISPR-associated protein Cas5/CasD [Ruminococcus sp.]|uniref:type I-E CRISPR-associated protein Cas5/CasD n=1 Tax=Ruminococcus sp. TaxID=41978 RepID=UPI0025DD4ABA|nr:type I-E CRISPR-associated protein Cas5/CasD [Ruminococcus sp.]MBO4865829.1 type I-E CRISPR-associated protein Cas5/CasD [Ruminococcus sp.]
MKTLLLRLSAPLQSWGSDSKFETRRTQPYPTKSGVIGMLAAALGISREDDDSLKELSSLRFGIRIDKEGELLRDYHTVIGEKPYITNRYYLADAYFLVGLESEDESLLQKLDAALKAPVYPLYLGRRSCPPSLPLVLRTCDKDLCQALEEEPWLLPEWRQKRLFSETERELRIIIEDNDSDNAVRDVPVSFSKKRRDFGWRGIREYKYVTADTYEQSTEHDPFTELR